MGPIASASLLVCSYRRYYFSCVFISALLDRDWPVVLVDGYHNDLGGGNLNRL